MNSSWVNALRGKSRWRIIAVTLILFGTARISAAPRRTAVPAQQSQAAQADFLPANDQPSAPDLALTREDERKADALAAFVEGVIAEDNADPDKALAAYQKTLNLDPGYTELSVKIAYELARRGSVADGINILKDSIKADPKEPLTYLYLSQLYGKYLKKTDLAIKYAAQSFEVDPTNIASTLALFELYTASNQTKKAEQVLDRAAKLEQGSAQYWLQLGAVFMRLYVKEDGTCAPENLKKLNAMFDKSLSLAGDDAGIIGKIADYRVISRQVKEAIPLYLRVINLKSSTNDPSLANVRDKLARSFEANGQRDEAIAMLQQLIKDNPLRYESYELLGELYEEAGDPEKALASYQQTLLIDSSQPVNYLRTAEMYLKIKKPGKAVEILSEARQKFPDLPQITYSLAVSLSQAKQHQLALTAFQEALREAENTQHDMINSAFYFAYGAAAEQAGMLEKSAELLKKSIEMDPGSSNAAQAYNYLGYMWVDRGIHLDEAGEFIKHALEIDPENPAFIDSLGWYYFKKGEPEKALVELKKAADRIQPEDAVVYEHLGDTNAKLNNTAQALIYWQKAAVLDPDNKGLAEKIESTKQKVTSSPSPDPQPAGKN